MQEISYTIITVNQIHYIKEMEIMDYSTSAAFLYSGGWRAKDKEQLIDEYDLTEEEAEELVRELADLEKEMK